MSYECYRFQYHGSGIRDNAASTDVLLRAKHRNMRVYMRARNITELSEDWRPKQLADREET